MDYGKIVIEILVLFGIMMIGFLASKLNIVKEKDTPLISKLVINITFPALIITSMQRSFTKELFNNMISIILISLVTYAVAVGITILWGKWTKTERGIVGVVKFLFAVGNVTFLGFPVIYAIYGDMGIFYAATFNITSNFLLFSFGVFAISGGESKVSLKKIFNPGFVATVLGILAFSTQIKLPYLINQPLTLVGGTTIPLALLIVGISLAEIHPLELIKPFKLWQISFFKMILLPIALFFALKALGFSDYLLIIPSVLMGMPAALTMGAFAENYGGDKLFASKCVVLTNLIAIGTVPLILWIFLLF